MSSDIVGSELELSLFLLLLVAGSSSNLAEMLTNCHVNNWTAQAATTTTAAAAAAAANQCVPGPSDNHSLFYVSNSPSASTALKACESNPAKETASSQAKPQQTEPFRLGQHPSMCHKRHRTTFKYYQVNILEEAFKQNKYPSPTFRDAIARETNLDVTRVQVWFQNRRAKHKRQLNQAMRCFVASAAASSRKSTANRAPAMRCQKAVEVVNQCAAQLHQQMALGFHLNSIQQHQQQQQQQQHQHHYHQQQQAHQHQMQHQQSLQQAALCNDVLAKAVSQSDSSYRLQQIMRPLNSPLMVNETTFNCHRRVSSFMSNSETHEEQLHQELRQHQLSQQQLHTQMGTHLDAAVAYQPLDCQNHSQAPNIHDQYA